MNKKITIIVNDLKSLFQCCSLTLFYNANTQNKKSPKIILNKKQLMQLINYYRKLDLLQKFSKTDVQATTKKEGKLPFLHNVRCYFTFS